MTNMHVSMSLYLQSGQKAAKTRLVQIKAWLGFGVFSETKYYWSTSDHSDRQRLFFFFFKITNKSLETKATQAIYCRTNKAALYNISTKQNLNPCINYFFFIVFCVTPLIFLKIYLVQNELREFWCFSQPNPRDDQNGVLQVQVTTFVYMSNYCIAFPELSKGRLSST
jgi:hypothetical protein